MIELVNVRKHYQSRSGRHVVIDDLNLRIDPGQKLGILGRNGAGKSTLIRLVSGGEKPSSGSIRRGMSVSWPLAFDGAFQSSLTGYDNARFISRIYRKPYEGIIEYVKEFSELGKHLREPFRVYSSGMKARFAFALSMAIDFDCFLIDEVLAVGDRRFQEKCHRELWEKRKDKALIVVSHEPELMKTYCECFAVLHGGHLTHFDNADDAYGFYESCNG